VAEILVLKKRNRRPRKREIRGLGNGSGDKCGEGSGGISQEVTRQDHHQKEEGGSPPPQREVGSPLPLTPCERESRKGGDPWRESSFVRSSDENGMEGENLSPPTSM